MDPATAACVAIAVQFGGRMMIRRVAQSLAAKLACQALDIGIAGITINMKEHTKGKRGSTHDKHTKKRSGAPEKGDKYRPPNNNKRNKNSNDSSKKDIERQLARQKYEKQAKERKEKRDKKKNFCVIGFGIGDIIKSYKKGAGIDNDGPGDDGPNGGGPGGIEFRRIEPFLNFNESNIIQLRNCNIIFETINEQKVREAFNSFCLPEFQNKSIKEYFETILMEIKEGTIVGESLPFISLHFNNDGLLYSVMHPYYKKTLVGNTLAFLDYFLKGFVNGGFFDVKFVQKWLKNPTIDLNQLNQNLIDVKKEIKNICPGYKSLYGILDQDDFGDEFTSAFRIVGEISNQCYISGQNIFPNCEFSVETDLHPSANFQKKIQNEIEAKKKYIDIVSAHNRMKFIIKQMMPKVPQIEGYFEILKMICFALHYVKSLDSVGLKIDINSAFQHQSDSYVNIIPNIFPPLPVRKTVKIDPHITIGDLLNELRSTNFGNEMYMILEGKSRSLTENTLLNIKNRITSLYKSRINNQISSSLNIQFLDDDDIELDCFINNAMINVVGMTKNFENILSEFFESMINSMKENFCQVINNFLSNNEQKIFNISGKNFNTSQLKSCCKNCLDMISSSYRIENFLRNLIPDSYRQNEVQEAYNSLDRQKYDLINILNRDIAQERNRITEYRVELERLQNLQNQYNNLDVYSKNLQQNIELKRKVDEGINVFTNEISNLENDIREREMNKTRICQEVDTKKIEIRNNISNEKDELRNENRKRIMKIVNKFRDDYQKFEQYYRNPLKIDQLTGLEHCISSNITLSTPIIANGKNGKSIRGGCLIKSTKNCFLVNSILSKDTLENIDDNVRKGKDFIKMPEVQGFLVDLKLSLFDDDILFENQEEEYLDRIGLSDDQINAMLGLTNDIEFDINKLNEKTSDGTPTIYFVCCTGNIQSIDLFIKKGIDFGAVMKNGMYPFLSLMENGHHDAALYVLKNNSIIKNINQCTETGVSPLHWAIYYGWTDIIKQLISRGASVTSSIKSNGMNAIHLACLHDQPKCLSVLITSPNAFYGLSDSGVNPLHVAACHSAQCAYILIQKCLVDVKAKDLNGHSSRDIAILNGQYEIAKKLPQSTQTISFISNTHEMKSIRELNFNSLCHAFSTGDLLNAEKIIAKFKEQNKHFDSRSEQKLIECACKGRCSEYVELLSHLINLDSYSIPILTARNGIINWLDELKKYGVNLIINNYQLLDEAVKNADHKFLDKAFEIIDKVPDSVMKRIIKKIIELDIYDIIIIVANLLNFNDKYSNIQLDINDVICYQTSILAFKLFRNNISQESISKMEVYIEYVSIPLLNYILNTEKFSDEQIKKTIITAYEKKRFDCVYSIINKCTFNCSNIFYQCPGLRNLTKENFSKARDEILNLIISNKINESQKINKLNDIFKMTFDIGLLKIDINHSLLDLAGKCFDLMWIIKALPNKYVQEFCFDKDFIFENQIMASFIYLIEILEGKFVSKSGNIFLNSLRNIDYDDIDNRNLGEDFIDALFKVMIPRYVNSIDDEGKTIFHIAAMIGNINQNTISKIIQAISKEKVTCNDILNARTRNGKTILMSFASKGNLNAINFLKNNGADITARDIFGNNILHILLQSKPITNDAIIEFIYKIGNEYRELILQRNRDGENPFFIAAKRGFNGILGVMSIFYPVKMLDNIDNNCTKSALHIATENNRFETVRYLVQTLHLDLNVRTFDSSGLMPIHCATISSSLLTFKEIIKLGGNPLAEDLTGKNSIYYAFAYGTREMILHVTKMISFNYEISTPNILIPLIQNTEATSIISIINNLFDDSAFKICDENGMSLISLAAKKNNYKIVQELLLLGSDPTKKDNDGKNSLHICAENNSIGCSLLIIKHIYNEQGFEGVYNLMNSPDEDGNLPIHIAAAKGYDGFVVHILSACTKQDLNRINNNGYNPISLSIKNGHKKVASIILNWCNINHFNLLGLRDEYKMLEKNEDLVKIADNIKQISYESEESYIEEENNEENDLNNGNHKSIIQLFNDEMHKLNIYNDQEFLSKFYRVLNNITVITRIINLIIKGRSDLVKKIIVHMKKQTPTKINLIAYTMLFTQILDDEINDFIATVDTLDNISLDAWNPLFAWIENGFVSAIELREPSMPLMPSIKTIMDFALKIYQSETLKKIIGYPCIPAPVPVIVNWIKDFKESSIRAQLQFINFTKTSCLFESKNELAIEIANRVDNDQYILIDFTMKQKDKSSLIDSSIDFQEYLIHSIYSTLELYEDPDIPNNVRKKLLNKCVEIAQKKKFSPKHLSKFVNGIRKVIDELGLNYLEKIINIIPQESFDITNRAISAILTIGSPDSASINLIQKGIIALEEEAHNIEKRKFSENRNLDEILNAFKKKSHQFIPYKFAFDGSPIVELKPNDLQLLEKLGKRLEMNIKANESLAEQGLQVGKNFKNNPTIENAADLISITRIAIQETLDLKPFIVQCLAVGALLLHRINQPKDLKGRIAQIATGEGKSIIIAMLSACVALTGNFVDVITSSFYLAKRDSEKFKDFYEKLGLKCGVLDENSYKPNTDYHIIYSTNTGFEFAFLREGIRGKRFLYTIPLNNNNKEYRRPMTAIVDEVDNLFLDTATNSARIADGCSSKKNWIFPPLFKAVSEGKVTNCMQARQLLIEYNKGKNDEMSIDSFSDFQLQRLISSATYANTLKKNVDYVVGFNNKTKEYEIQIVDVKNTGRINYGSRWCGGIHEFVEVKEGLCVKAQSLTMASISHPSFFKRYQEIYGLTGTLGEESERNEIRMMYGVDTFDVPPNRVCKRVRTKTLIVPTKEQKHDLIIKQIKEITKAKRPILVIVLTIEESQELSEKLKTEKISHYVLNDQQEEDEDFIIDRAGRCGAVTIATNTAGRGTDIQLDKVANEKGGLHVIIAFHPINIRVECQGLGRAGRQGQQGSCQIIFCSEKYSTNNPEATDETMKLVYVERSENVMKESLQRIIRVKIEHEIFIILSEYFAYLFDLRKFLESPEGEHTIRESSDHESSNMNDSESILNFVSQKWSEYYSALSNGDIEIEERSFDKFMNIIDKRIPLISLKMKQRNK